MTVRNENDTQSANDEKWEIPSIEWLRIDAIQGGGDSDDEGATDRTS